MERGQESQGGWESRSGRAGGNTGSRPQITDGAAGVAAESVSGGLLRIQIMTRLLYCQQSVKFLGLRRQATQGLRGGEGGREVGEVVGLPILTLPRPVDQSLMHDGPQLGKG
ncbi:hypothetical protein VC83_01981 [Pseudogymnoascus destructans]|uniref:Uncharacterized protein n=1 Tax=Pseudogymnoascus destructans TaxID=655981 RepID=A0A177AHU7_9PEZI|nr:uncharacterized protein VC83_01981 [Pseudogymnoascus destructans]OAF61675.1 hypothetical protein VC83_01981 [Pseudogymnoascus destructans]